MHVRPSASSFRFLFSSKPRKEKPPPPCVSEFPLICLPRPALYMSPAATDCQTCILAHFPHNALPQLFSVTDCGACAGVVSPPLSPSGPLAPTSDVPSSFAELGHGLVDLSYPACEAVLHFQISRTLPLCSFHLKYYDCDCPFLIVKLSP